MDITEAKVYEALGLEKPEQAPGAQETGLPADAQAPEETEQTESAEGAAVEAEEDTGPTEERPAAEPPPPGVRRTSVSRSETSGSTGFISGDPNEMEGAPARAQRSGPRGEAEQRAAIDRAVEEALKAEREQVGAELAEFFKAAGLKDDFNQGKPITSLEEFRTWRAAYDAQRLQRDLSEGRLTPEGLEQAIGRHPAIRQAEELVRAGQEAQRRAEEERQRAAEAAARARIEAEIAEIGKLDPTIREMGDLLKAPWGKDFYAYVKKGNSFLDAFWLANRERLTTQAAEAARQQALNAQRGKAHLSATKPQGDGAPSVPTEEMEMFKLFNPNATEAEIRAYYGKHLSKP